MCDCMFLEAIAIECFIQSEQCVTSLCSYFCFVLSEKAAKSFYSFVFHEHTIYHTQGVDANHYNTKVVAYLKEIKREKS